ncbi:peroxisomal biogenesis factor 19-like [Acanthaster planci]|uniref:Peroxin-19 n=1 Tax=Acanthaster planci TaxID=133434 RepID=A0A8B7YY15_ACAPL|nr:peroxisomal biogenesis factor 19-like [Acanthaster planci]
MAEQRNEHDEPSLAEVIQTSPPKSSVESDSVVETAERDGDSSELDDLLDSALKDFQRPTSLPPDQNAPEKKPERKADSSSEKQDAPKEAPPLPPDQEALFNQLFTGGEGAADFESVMTSVMSELGKDFGQDPGMNDDLLAKLLQSGGAEAFPGFGSTTSTEGAASSGKETLDRTLGDTINRLVQSAQDLKDGNIPEAEILKQMENMHLGDGAESEMMPMMQQMMQSLLSKEILYPSLKEVVEKYPAWLDQNQSTVKPEDFQRYSQQFELMKRLCSEYESETATESPDVKQQRMTRIMDLIQEMEGLGQPPTDIIGEGGTGPGLQFDRQGIPKIPGMPEGDQCSIM